MYENEIVTIRRPKKTLAINAAFALPKDEENAHLLGMHAHYSRFVVSLIDNSGDKRIIPIANIPVGDVRYMKRRTDICIEKLMNNSVSSAPESVTEADGVNKNGIAFTTTLVGKFKGKTPAAVLLEGNEELLVSTKAWLEENVEKYPANKKQIEAIQEALNLFHTGKLNSDTVPVPTSNIISIYKSDVKFLETRKRDDGKCLCYSIQVDMDMSKKYPFVVSLMNCYAPVLTEDSGQKKIMMKNSADTVTSSLVLTDAEWYNIISVMEARLNNFENSFFSQQYKISQEKFIAEMNKVKN